jgi:hypothetical protein
MKLEPWINNLEFSSMHMWWKIHRVHSFVVILVMVVDGDTLNNLKRIVVDAMVLYGGLIWETMVLELVT